MRALNFLAAPLLAGLMAIVSQGAAADREPGAGPSTNTHHQNHPTHRGGHYPYEHHGREYRYHHNNRYYNHRYFHGGRWRYY